MKERGENPLDKILPTMKSLWDADEIRTVRFPLFIKLGRIIKITPSFQLIASS
jgi:hypothetical protein